MGAVDVVGKRECGVRRGKRFEFAYEKQAGDKKVFMTNLGRKENTK